MRNNCEGPSAKGEKKALEEILKKMFLSINMKKNLL